MIVSFKKWRNSFDKYWNLPLFEYLVWTIWTRTIKKNLLKNQKWYHRLKNIPLQKNNNKCIKNRWCRNNNMDKSNTCMKIKVKKSPVRSERPVWTRRRLPTTPSCWPTGSPFSRWKRRRHGKRSRRQSAKRSRSCRSDSETRRTAPGETTSGECGSKRRRSGYIKMLMPKSQIKKQSWNRININRWSKYLKHKD